MTKRKLVTVEYNNFFIGFGHMFNPVKEFINFCKEIYFLHMSEKPLYMFLNGVLLIYTAEKDKILVEKKYYNEFYLVDFIKQLPNKYNVFSFENNYESLNKAEIDADFRRNMKDKILKHLIKFLNMYMTFLLIANIDIVHC